MASPSGPRNIPQLYRNQHQRGITIREIAHNPDTQTQRQG